MRKMFQKDMPFPKEGEKRRRKNAEKKIGKLSQDKQITKYELLYALISIGMLVKTLTK